MNPGGGVDQDHRLLAFATLPHEFLDAQQILAASRVLGEFSHALAAVEFLDGGNDCFAFRLCVGESNSVRKVAIGNIDGGFHDSILQLFRFLVKGNGNTADCVDGSGVTIAVATFVPAQADICRFLTVQTAPYIRKLLIRIAPNSDLRIRNAWVRGSNPAARSPLGAIIVAPNADYCA